MPQEDDLQFQQVEPARADVAPAPAPVCVACKRPIEDTYYAVGPKLICPNCRDAYQLSQTGGSRAGRLLRATLLGIAAGLLGALIWFGVRKITGYEIGLIAIVVGLLVGGAVRIGSRRRGGRGYQLLAVALTYCAIATNYMPDLFQGLWKEAQQQHATANRASASSNQASASETSSSTHQDSAAPASSATPQKKIGPGRAILLLIVVVAAVFVLALAAPVLGGLQNPIGLLIIAFALWEAWKINSRRKVVFSGPHSLAGRTAANPAAPPFPS